MSVAAKDTTQRPSLAEGVDKELTCAICLCRYTHPKVLPCLHSYCKECLEKLAKKARPQQELTCPQCKEVHPIPPQGGVDGFKTYFTVNNLLELLRVHETTASANGAGEQTIILCESGVDESPAVAHCLTCSDHLCESCFELHKKQKLSRGHNVVLLKDLKQLDKKTGIRSVRRKWHCEEHNDELLKLFCKTCQKVICRDCALVTHREHDYTFVHEFRLKAQEQLEGLVQKTKKKQTEFKVYCKHLAKIRETSLADFEKTKHEINNTFDMLIKSIEGRRKALLAELEALGKKDEKLLNAETDYLDMALARFSNSIQFTERLFENDDDVDVMLMSTQAKPALESLQQLSWDTKKAELKPFKGIFDQDIMKKCGSVGAIVQQLDDDDIEISQLPKEAEGPFSFDISLSQRAAVVSMDLTPILSVHIVCINGSQVEEPVEIQKKGDQNKWKISCKPKRTGQHKVTVELNTVVKEHLVMVTPFVGMKVVRGPNWHYTDEDGGAGTIGEVVKIKSNNKVDVKWPNGKTLDYIYEQGSYDIKEYFD